ncbi:hypothetical protein LCGC14_2928570, partial [marine sediment metagenome]
MTPEEYRAKLKTDFIFFLTELWADRKMDRYHMLGWAELDMAAWIANSDEPQRGALGPRGIGKTTYGTAAYSCFRWNQNPNCKIIIPSKNIGAAKKMVKLARGWISSVHFLKHLMPRLSTRNRIWRDNTDMFDVGPSELSKDPSCWATGISGQLENARADLIIADDVETRENTTTLEARQDLQDRVDEFTSIATFGKREIVYLGTFHHEESLYLAESEKGVTFRTWPIITPHAHDKVLNLAPLIREKIDAGQLNESTKQSTYDGSPVFPHRHDKIYLAERRARGRTYFAMQQMLVCDLADEERYPLRLRDLIVFDTAENQAPISIAWGMTNDQGRGTAIEEIKSLGFGNDRFHRQIFFDKQWAPFRGTK